jgi:hypothetical protein
MTMEDRFLLDSPAIEAAVKFRGETLYPSRRPGKNSLDDSPALGEGDAAYNGYFTLKDVSTYNEDGTVKEYRVAVCDGETWDAEKQSSGNSHMIARTSDNVLYRIEVKTQVVTVNESSTVAIRYCHGTRSAEIVAYKHPPLQHTGYFYYTIGDVTIKNKVMKIIQRHGTGTSEKTINGTAWIDVGYVQDFCVYYIQPEVNDDGTTPKPTEIVVCNGDSWDPVKKTSDNSTVVVNSTYRWEIEPQKINIETETGRIYVCYDMDKHLKQLKGETDDTETSKEDVITVYNGSPSGNCEDIAFFNTSGTVCYISQNHTEGTLRMWGVYNGCI